MKTQDLIAAHANGLKSSIHALEVQVTILKQLVGGKVSAATEADEDADTDADEDEDDDFGGKQTKATKGKKTAAFDEDDEDADAEESEDDEADEKPAKATKGKKAASFDEDDEDADADEDEAEEKPAKAAKGKKAAKLTIDDVNDACKERCGRTNRAEVLSLLKKNFKVKSVTDLEPADYEKCIKLLKGK